MVAHPPVLVAPDTFGGELRAPVVAAAIARGLERAGVTPLPELCPLSGGGAGTIEALLPALGGETGDGFALDRGRRDRDRRARRGAAELTGERLAAAAATGAAVVGPRGGRRAGPDADGRRGATPPSCWRRSATTAGWAARRCSCSAPCARPASSPSTCATRGGARLVAGAPFVLDALGFDARMRAARALIVGEARLDRDTLLRDPRHRRDRHPRAPVRRALPRRRRHDAIDRFDARILDLQAILEASTVAELEAAGEALAAYL